MTTPTNPPTDALMKTEELIAEAERLDKEATDGPFTIAKFTNYIGFAIYAGERGCITERWYSQEQEETYAKEMDANAKLFARSRTLLPELARRVKVALDAIRNAPHEPECHSRRSRVTPQGMQRGQCNCWLQSALDALEGGK